MELKSETLLTAIANMEMVFAAVTSAWRRGTLISSSTIITLRVLEQNTFISFRYARILTCFDN